MPGFVPGAADLMVASDVCVLPSLAEPFGLALAEAMALGRPTIATRAGGPLEIVLPGETGLLVEPRSPREMAYALIEIARDSTRAEEMGRRGRERYEQMFTVERMAREVREVYARVWRSGAPSSTSGAAKIR
jgi:glycosyltransferase involved in cell wall biosynthesis